MATINSFALRHLEKAFAQLSEIALFSMHVIALQYLFAHLNTKPITVLLQNGVHE